MNIGIPLPTKHGWAILLPIVPLCVAGVLTIHATDSSHATNLVQGDAFKQIKFIAIGVLAMFAALGVGYQRVGRFAPALFVLCLMGLAYLALDRWVDVPLVTDRRGSRRWIILGGTQVQPSEIMKIVYVLAVAWYLRYRRNYRTLQGLIAPFVITLIPMALITLQPDLGTVLLFLPILFAMLFAAGARNKHFAVILCLGLLCAPLFWIKIAHYQRLRITGVVLQSQSLRHYLSEPPTWLEGRPTRWDYFRPAGIDSSEWQQELDNWETETGYHLVRSKIAIGSGGITGQGQGKGIFVEYKEKLPEHQNDLVFAMIAHQWGLVGSLVTILCYATIVIIGYDVAAMTQEPFGRLVAIGLSTLFAVQTLTNLCMTVGLGPITGVTLPFVSAGGSSLVAGFIGVGLLLSVAQHRPVLIAHKPFEFHEEE